MQRLRKPCLIGIWIGISTGFLYGQAITKSEPKRTEDLTYESQRLRCNLKMAKARQIGLQQDRTQAQFLLEILTGPACMIESGDTGFGFVAPRAFHIEVAALTALGRLGDERLLPQMRSLGEKGWREVPFYRANLARLQVESRYSAPTSFEKLREKVQMYYELVGLSKVHLVNYLRSEAEQQTPLLPPTLERIALRHITEIVANAYSGGVSNAFQLLNDLDYAKDPPSALRVQLAQVPPHRRAEWLIARICQRKVFDVYADYEVQALIDCGADAIPQIMEALRATGTPRRMLLEALCAIEFSKGCPTLCQLAEGDDTALAQQAKNLLRFPVVVRASDW